MTALSYPVVSSRHRDDSLDANVGETEVKAAILGQVGIASNYGEKL